MEGLPDLAILRIATYLSARDLTNCTAVSKKWREKINKDSVWAPHLQFLDHYYSIQSKYKEMILCHNQVETLEPLCAAREQYIRDQCLRFNYRAGLYTVEQFRPKGKEQIIHCCNAVDKDGNYWLFLNTLKAVEAWNITNKPYFQSCALKGLSESSSSIYFLDTKVVLVVSNLVQIFGFDQPKYQLEFLNYFFFDQNTTGADIQQVVGPGCYHVHANHTVNGKFLIGYSGVVCKGDEQSTLMHIWDLDTIVKLATTPIINETLSNSMTEETIIRCNVHNGEPGKIIIVLINHDENNITSSLVTIFNIHGLRFLDFMRPTPQVLIFHCCIVDNCIVVYGSTQRLGMTRPGYFVSLCNLYDDGIVTTKVLSNKFNVNPTSQFIFKNPKAYIKTTSEIISVDIDSGRLMITSIIKDYNFQQEFMNMVGSFIFTLDNDGKIKIWDTELKCLIKDIEINNGPLDVQEVASLKNVDFPPKIIFMNVDKTVVSVLSFW